MVAKTNVITAFFIHLHIVIIRDVKNVRKIMNSRNISVLLKMVRNISIDMELLYLWRLSRIFESWRYISNRE